MDITEPTDSPTPRGCWINCEQEMPPDRACVYVHGAYTPDGVPKPRSTLHLHAPAYHRWSSTQWRGMVAISHWWKVSPQSDTSKALHRRRAARA